MGNHNSGRRPAPTSLRMLRGNPGKRPLNPLEPQPERAPASFDEPPEELAGDELAVAEWRRVVPLLRTCGLVTTLDKPALVALTQTWSSYLRATAKVRAQGMVLRTSAGLPVTNPYALAADRLLGQVRRLWQEFGIGPASRARTTALPARDPDPEDKWRGLL
jgi:P27 family predicted phage terminase small subunit